MPFLTLPGELRNRIYTFHFNNLFPLDRPIRANDLDSKSFALFLVNYQIHDEASSLFFKTIIPTRHIQFNNLESIKYLLKIARPIVPSFSGKVSLDVPYMEGYSHNALMNANLVHSKRIFPLVAAYQGISTTTLHKKMHKFENSCRSVPLLVRGEGWLVTFVWYEGYRDESLGYCRKYIEDRDTLEISGDIGRLPFLEEMLGLTRIAGKGGVNL
jgi:hypothetical protein